MFETRNLERAAGESIASSCAQITRNLRSKSAAKSRFFSTIYALPIVVLMDYTGNVTESSPGWKWLVYDRRYGCLFSSDYLAVQIKKSCQYVSLPPPEANTSYLTPQQLTGTRDRPCLFENLQRNNSSRSQIHRQSLPLPG
jgi:hypothetical protein